MSGRKSRFRHLPPTAVPIGTSDLQAGLGSSEATVDQFRAALASYLSVSHEACQVAASGRTALYCLLRGLKSEYPSRRQVVMPAYTCPAVARVAIDLELQPVFVDLSIETMGYLADGLAAAINDNSLAVVHVHPFGIPLPIEDVIAAAHSLGATVIEDGAQALGAKWDGRPVGTSGDYGLFSLGPGKPISTGGGGIAIANHNDGTGSISSWWTILPSTSRGASATAWIRQAALQLTFQPKAWWAATRVGLHRLGNHESSWGYNVEGLTPSQAGVGMALLPRLDEINAERHHKASILKDATDRSNSVQTVFVAEKAEAIYLRFPVLAENEKQREVLYEQFWSAGIGAGRLYERSLPSLYFPENRASFPGAEAIAKRLLTLPTHHYVNDEDIEVMIDILERFT